jgi:magnesium-transporting ATPase (P-type)
LLDYVAGLKSTIDDFGDQVKEEVNKKIAFKTVASKMRVLARCTPDVKYMLVTGLKEDSLVTVTGKSYDDIDFIR